MSSETPQPPTSSGEHTFVLVDNGRTLPVTVRAAGNFLEIGPAGYSECCAVPGAGSPVVLDFFNNRLRVLVFGDVNSEEPTHAVDLAGAAEALRTP